jgi:hypothetical protein
MLNNVKAETYKRHITESHKQIDKVQWANQYDVNIYMLKPIRKTELPKEIVKGVEFTRHSLGVENIEAGNKMLYRFSEPIPEALSITFYNQIKISVQRGIAHNLLANAYNFEDEIINKLDTIGGAFGSIDITSPVKNFVKEFFNPFHEAENTIANYLGNSSITSLFSAFGANIIDLSTADYFTKVGFMDILPKDGTMLLADDWLFEIEVTALNANWVGKREVKGTYVIDGEIQTSFGADQDQMQEITINFKRI